MAEGFESSDDEQFLLDCLFKPHFIKKRTIKPRPDLFTQLGDDDFHSRFRLTKATVLKLLEKIEEELEYPTDRSKSLSPINQLLITLRFYATGCAHMVIGDGFGIDKSTVCRTVHRVSRLIAAMSKDFIKFPSNHQERVNMMKEFYNSTMFPGVLGAIDGTHIPISSPGGDDAEVYRNRKGYFSLNVQFICDPNLYITDVVARWPGSVHDSTIFSFCHIRSLFENNEIDEGYLIGDSGYACSPYLLTPLANPNNAAELKYNERHIQTRNCVERTNGVAKSRFQGLKYGLRIKLENVPTVIVACCVLHNIAMIAGEDEPPPDIQLEDYIQERRKLGYQILFEDVEVLPPPPINNNRSTAKREQVINGHFANLV